MRGDGDPLTVPLTTTLRPLLAGLLLVLTAGLCACGGGEKPAAASTA
ncbi:MAG: hypothetical protein JWM31_1558, partial [Solirubrobacterales bacterium]|nr:hypothetical protein [Solirubrobacterales bacterium]